MRSSIFHSYQPLFESALNRLILHLSVGCLRYYRPYEIERVGLFFRKVAKTIPKSDANFDHLPSAIVGDTTTILNSSYKGNSM